MDLNKDAENGCLVTTATISGGDGQQILSPHHIHQPMQQHHTMPSLHHQQQHHQQQHLRHHAASQDHAGAQGMESGDPKPGGKKLFTSTSMSSDDMDYIYGPSSARAGLTTTNAASAGAPQTCWSLEPMYAHQQKTQHQQWYELDKQQPEQSAAPQPGQHALISQTLQGQQQPQHQQQSQQHHGQFVGGAAAAVAGGGVERQQIRFAEVYYIFF